MPTTASLFGLTPQEHAAATYTTLGEGGPGKDIYGVYSTLLNRKLSGGYGKNLVNIATAPQQFVANAGVSPAQIADPNFGRKRYGKRYDEVYNALNDPNKLAPVFNQLKGATSFRGQALLGNKQKGDVMLDPKGNFYFDYKPAVHQKGLKLLSSADTGTTVVGANAAPQEIAENVYNITVNPEEQDPKNFLLSYLPKLPKFDWQQSLQDAFNSGGDFMS